MTVLELINRNDDYTVETELQVCYNGKWMGMYSASQLVHVYGLCEVISFSRRQVIIIGRRNDA